MGSGKSFSLFFENNKSLKNNQAAYFYENPVSIISADSADKIDAALMQIKRALDENCHVAGWISYEAGLYLEDRLKKHIPDVPEVPFIYMGVFENRRIIDAMSVDHYWKEFEQLSYSIKNMKLGNGKENYRQSFDKIQGYLEAGDIYQVNFTQKTTFDFDGSSRAFYADLRNAQYTEYAAFINADNLKVLSLSPELFIRKDGCRLTVKPMKGTIKRGKTLQEDAQLCEALLKSEKERAENLMIVDLLRNDLSKFADTASVNVNSLFDVEKYQTLFTMTSTVTATVGQDMSSVDILTSVFPCGSVTGAPKIRAQQIIAELEDHQRGIYTGALGYFLPNGDMCFSVPIRTVCIDQHGKGTFGTGSAIVADSKAEDEYQECILKSDFTTKKHPRFDLIETMKWQKREGFLRFDQHLSRLANSSTYFSFEFDGQKIRKELLEHVDCIDDHGTDDRKVRLLLSRAGNISITSEEVVKLNSDGIAVVKVSDKSVNSSNVYLYHKTTKRELYQAEFAGCKADESCVEILFRNEKGEFTEGSYTNLFIKKGGVFYTPPVECGLLPGIYRQEMLNDKSFSIVEKPIYINDLKQADQIYICNSVRGLVPVKLRLN